MATPPRAAPRQAEARLRAEFGDGTDRHLLGRLRDAVTHVLPPAGARGLAVFVNRHTATPPQR